jgi:hypothetical protein
VVFAGDEALAEVANGYCGVGGGGSGVVVGVVVGGEEVLFAADESEILCGDVRQLVAAAVSVNGV